MGKKHDDGWEDLDLENNKQILIIGYGEVGKSIHGLYDKYENFDIWHIDAKDTEPDLLPKHIDIMHVCFGYNEKFSRNAIEYIERFDPELVIVHSTVAPLTTQIIYDNTKAEIVHSPIMGVHPNLTESIQRFRKIIGPCTKSAGEKAVKHFNEIGINCRVYNKSDESEVAKMLSTTYYGMCISFMQEVHKLCEEKGLDFDQVYTETNDIYNNGYGEMNKLNVRRPILKWMGEGISGHCVVENSIILEREKMLPNTAKSILKIGKPKE